MTYKCVRDITGRSCDLPVFVFIRQPANAFFDGTLILPEDLWNMILTIISATDIIVISDNDITGAVISGGDCREVLALANLALTEAVYYILLSLMKPMHGYGIMQNVEALSGGRVRLAAGTLYGAINTLLEKGWITALPGSGDSRKKEYRITDTGKKAVETEIIRLQELLENGRKIMGGDL